MKRALFLYFTTALAAMAMYAAFNNVYFVSMSYAVKLDGSEADVKNAAGEKIGTVQITRARPLPNEQDRVPGGPSGRSIHSRQLFSRY